MEYFVSKPKSFLEALGEVLGRIVLGPIIVRYIAKLFRPNEKTKRIIILGSKAAGKTTLWAQLRGRKVGSDSATQATKIDSFDVQSGGHVVKVQKTMDIGGGDLYVTSYYKELINEDGTFVYFLIDLMNLDETNQEVRSRLQLISKIIKDKKLKDCGFKILATHYDKYQNKYFTAYDNVEGKAKSEIQRRLNDIKNCSLKIDWDHIMVVNLLSDYYIQKIKKEITLEE